MVLECPVIAKSAKSVNPLDTTFSLNVRVTWVVESTVPETSVGTTVSLTKFSTVGDAGPVFPLLSVAPSCATVIVCVASDNPVRFQTRV